MSQDGFELLAGAGYGFLEGITRNFIPASDGVFDNMNNSIKNFSGTVYAGRYIGKAIAKGLICLLLL